MYTSILGKRKFNSVHLCDCFVPKEDMYMKNVVVDRNKHVKLMYSMNDALRIIASRVNTLQNNMLLSIPLFYFYSHII